MTLPTSNLNLSQALSEFGKSTPGEMTDIQGEKAAPHSVPYTPYWMSELFGLEDQINKTITISSNTVNWRLSDQGLDSNKSYNLTINIQSGVVIGSSSTGSHAFYIDQDFVSNSTVTVVNNGYIVGRGGNGGNANTSNGPSGSDGTNGGPAFYVSGGISYTLNVDNSNGIIGGGGGGAGGAAATGTQTSGSAGGGGGAGYYNGSGGSDNDGSDNGSNGSVTSGGNGGLDSWSSGCSAGTKDDPCTNSVGGTIDGRDGGGLGQNGQNGYVESDSSSDSCCSISGPGDAHTGSGGSGGNAVNNSYKISWISQGDIRGTIS